MRAASTSPLSQICVHDLFMFQVTQQIVEGFGFLHLVSFTCSLFHVVSTHPRFFSPVKHAVLSGPLRGCQGAG